MQHSDIAVGRPVAAFIVADYKTGNHIEVKRFAVVESSEIMGLSVSIDSKRSKHIKWIPLLLYSLRTTALCLRFIVNRVASMVDMNGHSRKIYDTMKRMGAVTEEKLKTADDITKATSLGKGVVSSSLQDLLRNGYIKRIKRQKSAGYYILK